MALASPFLALHALRLEPIMDGSARVTLALALLEKADPEPVHARAFRDAFACTPSEASHVLARMRAAGLIVRDDKTASYRMTIEADALRARLARKMEGLDLPVVALPEPATANGENHA